MILLWEKNIWRRKKEIGRNENKQLSITINLIFFMENLFNNFLCEII